MQEAEQAKIDSALIASASETVILRDYCESGWPIGAQATRMISVTGEKFTQFGCGWANGFPTAVQAREDAQAAFDRYAEGRSGTLYWRVPPEIAFAPKQRKYAYYMRLLISDKPVPKKVD